MPVIFFPVTCIFEITIFFFLLFEFRVMALPQAIFLIRWGRDVKTQNKSGFRYGSYDENKKLIRLHPRLKQSLVPIYVLEFTLYHEMCHQFAPSYKRNGSWQSHHPEFKKKEKEYKNFKDARNWEKNNWHKLLLPANEELEAVKN